MTRIGFLLAALAALALSGTAAAENAATKVRIVTTKGDIVVALYPDRAPKTVANFLEYVKDGHYDRTLFHRVARGFVIQGGGYSRLLTERPTRDPVPYEGDNGLKNERGTIAMARYTDPDSATAQWYINLADNAKLDHAVDQFGPRPGYTVFGKVIDGMKVVDAIGAVETGAGGPFEIEVPAEPIFIERVEYIE